jgi:hypothetical protein
MDDIKTERVNGDLKTTVKGKVVHEFVLDRWTIYNKYPLITKWYQIPDFIKNDLGLQFYSTMSGWDTDIKIYEPIYTKGKSVSRILDEICKQVTKYVTEPSKTPGKITRWKLINNNTIIIYRDVDLTNNLLNNQYKITAPSIHYTDLFEYTENSDNYQIQTIGIPTLKAGIVFQINTTGVPDFVTEQSAYFVAQEVEHTITCKDGYLMKIHAKKAAQESK